jgi:hypothetical protein
MEMEAVRICFEVLFQLEAQVTEFQNKPQLK